MERDGSSPTEPAWPQSGFDLSDMRACLGLLDRDHGLRRRSWRPSSTPGLGCHSDLCVPNQQHHRKHTHGHEDSEDQRQLGVAMMLKQGAYLPFLEDQ